MASKRDFSPDKLFSKITQRFRDLQTVSVRSYHTRRWGIDIEFLLGKEDGIKEALEQIQLLMTTELELLAIRAIRAIIAVVTARAEATPVGAYEYIVLSASQYTGVKASDKADISKFSKALLEEGFVQETRERGAEEQFRTRIIPMIARSQPIPMSGGNEVRVGAISLSELSTVQITDLAPTKMPSEVFQGDAQTTTGEVLSSVGSEYTDTWQIIEFGTGKFAKHPFWGYGPRLTGVTKVSSDSAHPGAWYLGKNLLILGQEGAHFLTDPRRDVSYAAQETQAAIEAIELYLKNRL